MSEEELIEELSSLFNDIENDERYTDTIYRNITNLQLENKQLKGILQQIYERAINTNITSLDFREYILKILGGNNGEIN